MADVFLDWGAAGARALAARCATVVVCDVLSFSTCVSVAVARGVSVWPHRWRDETAARRAAEIGAVLAGERRAPRAEGQSDAVSLSPCTMSTLVAGTSVLLPSPNGATCSLLAAEAGAVVVAGCLRNAPIVAGWLATRPGPIGLLACGELWPDGSLRPAYEDLVGAGAVAALLDRSRLSPEAEAAALAAEHRWSLMLVPSGEELAERGFADDVAMAEEYGADAVVPILVDGCFVSG